MYAMTSDLYECDFCGVQMKWDETDPVHGNMWECEKCGAHFCERCFEDRFGIVSFHKMLRDENEVHCPGCWEKAIRDKAKKKYMVTIVRTGYLEVAADSPEEALDIADHQMTDTVSWSDDWDATDAAEDESIPDESCITEKAFE